MPSHLLQLAAYFGFMALALSIASLPLEPQTLLAVKIAPPWLVAALGALAAGCVAPFDHWLVRRAFRFRLLDSMRQKRLFMRAEGWAKAWPFTTTVVFAALPLPFTVARVLVPLGGYPLARYLLAVMLGRYPRIYAIAALGQLFDIPTRWLVIALAASVGLAVTTLVLRRLSWQRRARRERAAAIAAALSPAGITAPAVEGAGSISDQAPAG